MASTEFGHAIGWEARGLPLSQAEIDRRNQEKLEKEARDILAKQKADLEDQAQAKRNFDAAMTNPAAQALYGKKSTIKTSPLGIPPTGKTLLGA